MARSPFYPSKYKRLIAAASNDALAADLQIAEQFLPSQFVCWLRDPVVQFFSNQSQKFYSAYLAGNSQRDPQQRVYAKLVDIDP